MPLDTYYKDHWVDIEADRMDRYEQMFAWTEAQSRLLEPAGIATGQMVGDFGCGPGFITLELLKRVGRGGHVHGMDLNREFLDRARHRAEQAGVADHLTLHQLVGPGLPLPDATLDRLIAKNVLVYVDDPAASLREFRRVLRKGGRALVIDSDFPMSVTDPVPASDWQALVAAASHAFRTPSIGRQLHRLAREAGFEAITLEVIARPDTTGRLLNLLTNFAGYARLGGELPEADIQRIVDTAQQAAAAGNFLAINPQFVLTATA